jgi:hypothetical protein
VEPRIVRPSIDSCIRIADGQAEAFASGPAGDRTVFASEVAGNRARRHAARYFTGLMATHAVRNDEDVELRQEDEPILVVHPLSADIGHSCRDRAHWAKYSSASAEG